MTTHNPGSPIAVKSGCTCPRIDNCHGDGYRGNSAHFLIAHDCPLHDEEWVQGRKVARDGDAGLGLAV
jgi:hypothetical protein